MMEKDRVWVSYPDMCIDCNFQDHKCFACGAEKDHDGWDVEGNLHDTAFCRPDLVAHSPGPLCTWPSTLNAELDEILDRPKCYWDHANNKLKEY